MIKFTKEILLHSLGIHAVKRYKLYIFGVAVLFFINISVRASNSLYLCREYGKWETYSLDLSFFIIWLMRKNVWRR